jgi:hypothetical protein
MFVHQILVRQALDFEKEKQGRKRTELSNMGRDFFQNFTSRTNFVSASIAA